MEIRIGIAESPQTLEVELAPDSDRDAILADIEKVLGGDASVLRVTDRKGKEIIVSATKISFVEVGSGDADRRIGFGA